MLEIKEEECTHLRSLINEKSNSSNPICRTEVNSTIPPTKPIPAPRKRPLKNETKPKITILGSSMVRNTGPHISENLKEKNTCVYAISGLTISDANAKTSAIFAQHDKDDIAVLQVGTNDLPICEAEELITKYDNLINEVKLVAPDSKLVVTAVADRIYPGSATINQKSHLLNKHLRNRCLRDKNLVFIDANPELLIKNYRYDGTHFNYNGTKFFANFLSSYLNHSENFPLLDAMKVP